ncbi:MAG: phage major capsid protein [Acetatifactor sp.]
MPFLKDELSGFVPTEQATKIIKNILRGSSVLRLANVEPMTSDKKKVSVMTDGVGAYWVGEGKRIKTDKPTWIFPTLVAKKLAVIIPVTKEKLSDSTMSVFDECEEAISEAFCMAIDAAAFFGTESPFEKNIFSVAEAEGNIIVRGSNKTLDLDVSDTMALVEGSGTDVDGHVAHYGIKNDLRKLRDANGNALYVPGTDTNELYNMPIEFSRNKAWDKDKAELITGDWSKFRVGLRQDIEYEILKEATLQGTLDEDGKPLSLAEQDMIAIKATARIGMLQVKDDAFAVLVPSSYHAPDNSETITGEENV